MTNIRKIAIARPSSVKIAVGLMATVMAYSLVAVTFHISASMASAPTDDSRITYDAIAIFVVCLTLISFAMMLTLAVLTWTGREWPRYVYATLSVVGLPSMAGSLAGNWKIGMVLFIISITSAILLFIPASNRWFKANRS